MIDVINVRVFKREIVPVASDRPRRVMAGKVINCEVVGIQPINAIYAVRSAKIRRGSADVEVLNDQILYGARSAASGVHCDAVLSIGPACAIRSIFNGAVGTAIDDDVAKTVHVNRASASPVGRGENCPRHEFNDDRVRGSSTAVERKILLARMTNKNPTKIYSGAGADLI